MRSAHLAWIITLAACKSHEAKPGAPAGSGGEIASCNPAMVHSCWEYNAAQLAAGGRDQLARECPASTAKGQFTMKPCPTIRLISTCTRADMTEYIYEGDPDDRAALEKDCEKESHGTFTWKGK
jgi:hypothetical protein